MSQSPLLGCGNYALAAFFDTDILAFAHYAKSAYKGKYDAKTVFWNEDGRLAALFCDCCGQLAEVVKRGMSRGWDPTEYYVLSCGDTVI